MRRSVATMLRFFGKSLALRGVRARPVDRILKEPVLASIIERGHVLHAQLGAGGRGVWTASSSTA